MARLLWVGESSYLNSGYGVCSREILVRLYLAGIEVYELGVCGTCNDPREASLPWHFIPGFPTTDEERSRFGRHPQDQFGRFKFDQVVAAVKPDIVMDFRDPWMFSFEAISPLRPYYRWIPVFPIDGVPLNRSWVSMLNNADAVGVYTKYGQNEVSRYGIPSTVIPLGVDYKVFRPAGYEEKSLIREQLGIHPEAFAFLSVMRNQARKLIPDLIESFGFVAAKCPLAVLYLHTFYPDIGWDIPELLRQSPFSSRILFTYYCPACETMRATPFKGPTTTCPCCGNPGMQLPNGAADIPSHRMRDVYAACDCYVQYSTCEGFGLPQVEAAACHLPVIAVDHSGMAEVTGLLYPDNLVRVERSFFDPFTSRKMVLPDNAQAAEFMARSYDTPEPVRYAAGKLVRDKAMKHFCWDIAAGRLLAIISQLPPARPWNEAVLPHQLPTDKPRFSSVEDLVRWGFVAVAGRPELLSTWLYTDAVSQLSNKMRLGGENTVVRYAEEDFLREMLGLAGEKKQAEMWRQT